MRTVPKPRALEKFENGLCAHELSWEVFLSSLLQDQLIERELGHGSFSRFD